MNPAIVVHGGAGVIPKNTPAAKIEAYKQGLKEALEVGFAILEDGGSALDATMEAVIVFENNHLYNAGKGAVYTSKETHEMDAATMDGHTLNSGAACFVGRVKNPIKLARAILEKSPHALLCGEGAEDFARTCHLELVENSYFDDEYRYNQLLKAKQEKTIVRDHDISVEKPMGTVGAVALDSHGNLAASTSTGGTTNKSVGRIGDTPLIGAGNYANNATCAVSCTGFGEEFMRKVAAHDLHSRMIYGGLSLTEAANAVVSELIDPGTGGLIAIDRDGDIAMPFNTPGMFRGYKRSSDDLFLNIWE